MIRKSLLALGAAAFAIGMLVLGAPAHAEGGVKAGTLTCYVEGGWGFVFGSSRDLYCTYSPQPGVGEHYKGKVTKFGVDIGYVSNAVIVWLVVAPSSTLAPGAIAGDYGGATGSATVGIGLGANVLIGGSNSQITLQPLSIEGNTGLNVAGGIAAISLTYQAF